MQIMFRILSYSECSMTNQLRNFPTQNSKGRSRIYFFCLENVMKAELDWSQPEMYELWISHGETVLNWKI